MPLESGHTVGDYEVLSQLGTGGIGDVYKVRHVISQRTEALKLLLGVGAPLVGRLLSYDALEGRFRELQLRRDSACRACGDGARPTLQDTPDVCAPGAHARA